MPSVLAMKPVFAAVSLLILGAALPGIGRAGPGDSADHSGRPLRREGRQVGRNAKSAASSQQTPNAPDQGAPTTTSAGPALSSTAAPAATVASGAIGAVPIPAPAGSTDLQSAPTVANAPSVPHPMAINANTVTPAVASAASSRRPTNTLRVVAGAPSAQTSLGRITNAAAKNGAVVNGTTIKNRLLRADPKK